MQREYILAQIKEAAERIKMHIHQLETENHFTHAQAEDFLHQTEKLYRNLSIYEHALKNGDIAADLNVHLKIMQAVTNIEANTATEKIIETEKEAVQEISDQNKQPEQNETSGSLRTIELSINNKFRIANELFAQNQMEFQAAIQQLNSITSKEEAGRYLDSLRQVYKWKDENPLVKSFYALVQKRFE